MAHLTTQVLRPNEHGSAPSLPSRFLQEPLTLLPSAIMAARTAKKSRSRAPDDAGGHTARERERERCFSSAVGSFCSSACGLHICQVLIKCFSCTVSSSSGPQGVRYHHQTLQITCAGLNVLTPPPPNLYVEILTLRAMVIGKWGFGMGLSPL